MYSATRAHPSEARTPIMPAGHALRHLREVLELHAGPVLANFTVDRRGDVGRAPPMFHQPAAPVPPRGRARRESTLAALLPELIAALALRAGGAGRTVHDAWLGHHEVRVRYWLMPGASRGHTELSIYVQFA
jgi:hypothetical protein